MTDRKEYWKSPSGVTYEIGAPYPPSNIEKKPGYVWTPSLSGYHDKLSVGTLDDAAYRIQIANEAQHHVLQTKK